MSGLALGIDAVAHRAAFGVNGCTVGVVGQAPKERSLKPIMASARLYRCLELLGPLAKPVHADPVDDEHETRNHRRTNDAENRRGLHESHSEAQASWRDEYLRRLNLDANASGSCVSGGFLDLLSQSLITADEFRGRPRHEPKESSLNGGRAVPVDTATHTHFLLPAAATHHTATDPVAPCAQNCFRLAAPTTCMHRCTATGLASPWARRTAL